MLKSKSIEHVEHDRVQLTWSLFPSIIIKSAIQDWFGTGFPFLCLDLKCRHP